MKLTGRIIAFSVSCFFTVSVLAQGFSNKGKDFWLGYGYHQRMSVNTQNLVLYFTSDSAANITVTVPGVGYTANYSLPANTVLTSSPLPKTGAQDCRLLSEGLYNTGIHIVADKPIVVYAQIYSANVTGATLLLPSHTLGKEYYSINYTQKSNETGSNSYFFVCAADTGTTTVEITPAAATLTHPVGIPFTVNLTQGQIYNVMGQLTGNSGATYFGVDLTGSRVISYPGPDGLCKRIAVFSGSGKISINCSSTQDITADNLFSQSFPAAAWGKRYLTAPTMNMPNNIFRISVSDPTSVVKVNGVIQSVLVNSFYYDIAATNQPKLIESDKPITVAQFITSAGNTQLTCGNRDSYDATFGDPEMIYLSPLEQNIDSVILYSTPYYGAVEHYINVIVRSNATGSVYLDGTNVSSQFVPHPGDNNYSYAQLSVSSGVHKIISDSAFNVIAYGYGNFESYGYNGGMNVRGITESCSGFIWIGVVSSNWIDPLNWSNGIVPGRVDEAIIPQGTPFSPIVYDGTNTTCKNVFVLTGATLTIQKNAVLNITH